MSKFTFMQPVAVSDTSDNQAIANLKSDDSNYYYLFTSNDGRIHVRYIAKHINDEDTCWYNYAVAIPEKKRTPYTFDTFPKCHTLLKFKTLPAIRVVIYIKEFHIETSKDSFKYASMTNDIELSFDSGKTWVPFWLEG